MFPGSRSTRTDCNAFYGEQTFVYVFLYILHLLRVARTKRETTEKRNHTYRRKLGRIQYSKLKILFRLNNKTQIDKKVTQPKRTGKIGYSRIPISSQFQVHINNGQVQYSYQSSQYRNPARTPQHMSCYGQNQVINTLINKILSV